MHYNLVVSTFKQDKLLMLNTFKHIKYVSQLMLNATFNEFVYVFQFPGCNSVINAISEVTFSYFRIKNHT